MNNTTREHQALPEEMSIKKQVPFIDLYSLSVLVISFFIVIKYFHSRAIGLNTSRDRIYPQLKLGKIPRIFPSFQTCACRKKDVQNNKHNSLHLGRKICSGICRWTLSVPISKRIMSADNWRLLFIHTSICDLPTLTYTWRLKKTNLQWVPHPPPPGGYLWQKATKWLFTFSWWKATCPSNMLRNWISEEEFSRNELQWKETCLLCRKWLNHPLIVNGIEPTEANAENGFVPVINLRSRS